MTENTPTYHIGITMAGAVTAGAYSGGVLDYLFEILDLWDQLKRGVIPDIVKCELDDIQINELLKYIPKHNVVIDVIGGASAGGMTASISAVYALENKIKPVRKPLGKPTIVGNLFYESWVNLNDIDKEHKTFEQSLNVEDLNSGEIKSILNSNFIVEICNRSLMVSGEIEEKKNNMPSFISKDLELVLSHCLLQGIPLGIEFGGGNIKHTNTTPVHYSYDHLTLSRFCLNKDYVRPETHINTISKFELNPYDNKLSTLLKECSVATGAFPIGLEFRTLSGEFFTEKYLKSISELILDKPVNTWNNFPNPFNLTTIDGGMINNEPIDEVHKLLKWHAGNDMRGIVMVDPFPDFYNNKDLKIPDNLFNLSGNLYQTLREQTKIKRTDLLNIRSNNDIKSEIFPVKWNAPKNAETYPLACASMGAFGGLLDFSFREHDFFLGRNNSRNFFQYFFSLPKDAKNEIHNSWSDEIKDKWTIIRKDLADAEYLPIIPDIYYLIHKIKNNTNPDRYLYTIKKKPQIDPIKIFELRNMIESRIKRIIDISIENISSKKSKKMNSEEEIEADTYSDMLINNLYPKNILSIIWNYITRISLGLIILTHKSSISKLISKKIYKLILKDLAIRKMLKQ